MSEWRPMPAPNNGRPFLIYSASFKDGVKRARRGATTEPWFVAAGYTAWDDHGNPCKATHWMPLPEPPK